MNIVNGMMMDVLTGKDRVSLTKEHFNLPVEDLQNVIEDQRKKRKL